MDEAYLSLGAGYPYHLPDCGVVVHELDALTAHHHIKACIQKSSSIIIAASIKRGNIFFSFSVSVLKSASRLTVVYLANRASSRLICLVVSFRFESVKGFFLFPHENINKAKQLKRMIFFISSIFFKVNEKLKIDESLGIIFWEPVQYQQP